MSSRQDLQRAELGYQIVAFYNVRCTGSYANELDTETVYRAQYIREHSAPPASKRTRDYPLDWNINRSTVNRAVRLFLRLTNHLVEDQEFRS
ncbi:hypothetical protein EYZ11_013043 [Aspergillus tanneri]|uniref:Uncharacterized protein n=1 Tax=Aspergillus tanneri TaxID=1220188 RepID=A0A4S3IYN5_9EURO|nr:hypothetical protein EYZ11_013043 [Aspergillus tanneri]